MRGPRTVAMALLALALAGCFVSTEALIPPEEADWPLAGITSYELFTAKDGGESWEKDQDGTVTAADGGYVLDGDPESRFVMRDAFGTFYIAQQQSADGFQYDLVRVEGDRLYVYGFTCGDEDRRHVAAGLIREITADGNEARCRVDSFRNLMIVFRERYFAGAKPKSLYVIK